MDFVVGLPRMMSENNALFIGVDRLNKVASFIPMNYHLEMEQVARAYVKYVIRFHGVPVHLCLNEILIICYISGRHYNRLWGLCCCIVRPFIHRHMNKRRGRIRF